MNSMNTLATTPPSSAAAKRANPAMPTALPAANPARLERDVRSLCGIQPARNYRNTDSLDRAAQYIREQFAAAGYTTRDQTWTATHHGVTGTYINVIATYNPAGTRVLVLGAHYDVDGDQPGADDNASAVAGLLETARLIAAAAPDIDYRIEFVAYSLEEAPFSHTPAMGSRVHARSLQVDGADVIGMICYEMIGYFTDQPHSQTFPPRFPSLFYPKTGNFLLAVGSNDHTDFFNDVHRAMTSDPAIAYGLRDPSKTADDDRPAPNPDRLHIPTICFPSHYPDAIRSDHASYWAHGFPALMLTDTAHYRNPNYHQPSDTPDTLHYPKMAQVVNATCLALTAF